MGSSGPAPLKPDMASGVGSLQGSDSGQTTTTGSGPWRASPGTSSSFSSSQKQAGSPHPQREPMSSPTTRRSPSPASPPQPHRTPVHVPPRPKRYIGHYDIADRTFQLLSRHRAAACILFWSLTILLDILLQLPIEWFFLFYFILALVFRIFFIGGHIVLISIGAMCVANAVVFYTVPFSFTSPFATGVAFGLMVSLIHGLNLKGVILAMTMYMLKPYLERQTLITALNPPTTPSIVFLAPLAAFCSAFGVLWLLYDLFGYLHASTDDLRDFFGITLPAPSIVTLKDVKDRSITLNWQCSSQATISKHLIEIDGLLIGESGKQETSVVIQGLYPDNTYRIRLWAITTRNWKTPSDYIVVRTLASVPVELELSSVENARRESELANRRAKTEGDVTSLPLEPEQDSITAAETEDSTAIIPEKPPSADLSGQTPNDLTTASAVNPAPPAPATTVLPQISTESIATHSATVITDEQVAALRLELEGKDAAHMSLMQQLGDLEKQYKSQEDQLKKEISALRDQQRSEEEPRQQAKARLKELQESLREAEVNRGKVEKEHKVEMDKKQRMTEQLEARQKKIQRLQQSLRESEDKLRAEKEAHRQRKLELEASLKSKVEDAKAAEATLREMQESQKTLCNTIELKESELYKLQMTLNSPKSLHSWEQRNKDLDNKCAFLADQLEQYKLENQQLQERLSEATKSIAKVRQAHEAKRQQVESSSRAPRLDSAVGYGDSFANPRNNESGSTWVGEGWGHSLGTSILNGLFQDETSPPKVVLPPTRKLTGPPPGLPMKGDLSEATFSVDLTKRNRDRADSSSPRMNSAHGPSDRNQQPAIGARRRSPSTLSHEFPFAEDMINRSRIAGFSESPVGTPGEGDDRGQGSRSRTSSTSSANGFQSPLFETSFNFGNHPSQHQQSQEGYTTLSHSRVPHHRMQQTVPGHIQSPRSRFQAALPVHSPPMANAQTQWGGSGTAIGARSGMGLSVSTASSHHGFDLEGQSTKPTAACQAFNYHRFFSPAAMDPVSNSSSSSTSPSTLLSEVNSVTDHQMNEQNMIKSMFESTEPLDLRHHLRSVGSHSSLTTQAKILPSHLRSISTPGVSSPLSSPTTASGSLHQQASPSWDLRPIGRPGTLGRMNSQAEGSSTSLNISDTSSPTSPQMTLFSQSPSGYGRKSNKESTERSFWGAHGTLSDKKAHGQLDFGLGLHQQGSREFGSSTGGVGDGILSSPNGSAPSLVDHGGPKSVDALTFADQYFSNRSYRGFEPPSTFSSAPRKPAAVESSSMGSSASAYRAGDVSQPSSSPSLSSTIKSVAPAASAGESNIFGYGLKLNPFGWSLPPADMEDDAEHKDHIEQLAS